MKYIQSFYQYPVTFSSIGRTVPSSLAQGEMRNICEVTENELDKLKNCEPRFRELVNQKKYRILNHIPASYVPASEQINNANAEAERLRKENEALKKQLADAGKTDSAAEEDTEETVETDYDTMEYKELQEAAKEKGINPNQKKTALIAALKEED